MTQDEYNAKVKAILTALRQCIADTCIGTPLTAGIEDIVIQSMIVDAVHQLTYDRYTD